MSASTSIAIREDQTTFDDFQVAALRQLGVDQASNADLAVFFHTCKRTGLDPFARQVYMIRRGGKQTMQTGIDGLRLVAQRTAERTRETFGYEDTMWADSSGVWHDMWLSSDAPAAAKVTVVRNGQRFPAVAMHREYVQSSPNWREKPALMLAKCAEAAALRKAFPMDLSGIYTPDEVRDEPVAAPAPQFIRGGGSDSLTDNGRDLTDDNTEDAEVVPDDDARPLTARTRGKMFALLNELGIDDEDEQRAGMARIVGRTVESRGSLSEDEAQKVVDHLQGVKRQREIEAVQRGEA